MYEPTLTYTGNPLSKVYFPEVETRISTNTNENLEFGFVPNEQIVKPETQMANLISPIAGMPKLDIGESVFKPVEQMDTIKKIPTNLKEAYDVLHLISNERKSKSNPVFDNAQLKEIAKNLNLLPTGKKEEIVARIRKAVSDYMQLNLN